MYRRRFRPWLTALRLPAGTTDSAQFVEIGPAGSSASRASDPTVLLDVFAQVGGANVTMYGLAVEHYQAVPVTR